MHFMFTAYKLDPAKGLLGLGVFETRAGAVKALCKHIDETHGIEDITIAAEDAFLSGPILRDTQFNPSRQHIPPPPPNSNVVWGILVCPVKEEE